MGTLLVPLVALLASGLTLVSGFGLGTLLLPVTAVFFPLDTAVALVAVAHLASNLLKLALLGRRADRDVVWRFGVPAVVAALAGASLFVALDQLPALAVWELRGQRREVTWAGVVIGLAMVAFAVVELRAGRGARGFSRRWLPAGGLVSGFFGGLSGHQGALRSMFLIRAGLDKEAYVGTGVVIACLVDVTRLSVYGAHFAAAGLRENAGLLAATTAAALAGAYAGSRLLRRVTLRGVQVAVAAMLVVVGLGLAAGLV